MRQRHLAVLALLGACAAACGGSKSPTAPAGASITGLSLTYPAGGTIYIGSAPQLQAAESLSDGTTRAVTAVWSTDAPAVATVTQTGVVAAIGAGEATIAADASGRRGTLRIRVYPNFNGDWTGGELIVSCDDSGDFEGACSDPAFAVGSLYLHRSRYTQTDAAVNATIEFADGVTASGPATVSTGGELELISPIRTRPEDDVVKWDIEGLRFRSDVPARLTGTYTDRFTAPGVQGSVALGLRLESVDRTAVVASNHRAAGQDGRSRGSRIARMHRMLR